MKRPLFAVGIAYMAGAVVAVLFLGQYSFLAGIFCLCIGGICSFLGKDKLLPLGIVFISVGLAMGVYTYFYTNKYLPALSLNEQKATITGIVLEKDLYEGNGSLLVQGKVEGVKDTVKICLYTRKADEIRSGDQINVKATLSSKPQHNNGNYNQFSKGIFLDGYIEGNINILSDKGGILSHILHFKEDYLMCLKKVVPSDVFAVLASLTIGDKGFLSPQQKQVIADSGITHLTAVSGTHLVIVVAVISCMLRIFNLSYRKSAVITIATVIGFMVFTGLSYSVCRAGIMLILMDIGKLFGREEDYLTSWGAASVVLIMQAPYCAVNIGFLMSMLACLGIIIFLDRIFVLLRGRQYHRSQSFGQKLTDIIVLNLSLSFAAHAFILPILSFIFGYIPIFSPITTMLVAWLLPILFVLSPLAVVLMLFSLVLPAKILGALLTIIVRIIMAVAQLIAEVPFSVFYTSKNYVVVWIVMAYFFMGVLFLIKAKTSQKLCGLVICAFTLLLGGLTDTILNRNVVEVAKVDHVLVVTEGKRAAVIGSLENQYDSSHVATYLNSKGIRNLDVAMVTSSTEDALGYVYLLRDIGASTILLGDEERFYPHIEKTVGKENIVALDNSVVSMFRGIKVYNKVDENGYVDTVLQIGDKLVLKTEDCYDILVGEQSNICLTFAGNNYLYKEGQGTSKNRNIYSDCVVSFRY